MLQEPILRDVKFLHAKIARSSTKMHNCIKMQYFCKSTRKSLSCLRLLTVNNTAPGRRQWLNRRTLKGKSDIRSLFARRPPIKSPFFRTKCLRGDVKISFLGEGRCQIAVRMLDVLPKNQCWTEILIPSHDKMAAVDSFDTKKFFFFSRSSVEGEGPRYHALRESSEDIIREGRSSTARHIPTGTSYIYTYFNLKLNCILNSMLKLNLVCIFILVLYFM